MSNASLWIVLIVMIVLCAFFSLAEISMMAVNRYRLKHLANAQHKDAQRVLRLIEKPDRLLSVILIGNTLVCNFAASIATVLALQISTRDSSPIIATILLTIVMLIIGEVMPKTWAAIKPEQVSYPCARILEPLLKLCMPLVMIVNSASNFLLKLFGLHQVKNNGTALSSEEFRSVVNDTGVLISPRNRAMLLSVIDLNKATVRDIMIPRNQIDGIDLRMSEKQLKHRIINAEHTRLPVYEGDINHVVGILHIRNAAKILSSSDIHVSITEMMHKPYFIFETTALPDQLRQFQKMQRRVALVVDEYGDIQGLATLEDILEEIVGDFTTQAHPIAQEIIAQAEGYIIPGKMSLREINRTLHWSLPTYSARTLNGLINESLETIPQGPVALRVNGYQFEVLEIKNHFIVTVFCKNIEAINKH